MNKNILISGWPGAGVTTITGILSYSLGKKLLRGTESFRYIWKKLGYADTGLDAAEVERIVQPYYGKIFDAFIDVKLTSGEGIIIESDIGGFRVGKNESYKSIFVIADDSIRAKRLGNDGRPEDTKVRETSLREEYKKLHGFDWFDLDTIKKTYDFVLDNSHLSIEEEMTEIYKFLYEQEFIFEGKFKELTSRAKLEEERYFSAGKSWYFEKLAQDSNIITAEETIKEIREMFKEEVLSFPKELKQVINNV